MSRKPEYENQFERVAHDCVKWSERKVALIKNHHGRDEVLAETVFDVRDFEQSSFECLLVSLLLFVKPLVPAHERGKRRFALVVQARNIDLFGQDFWDDFSVSWL